MTKTKSRRVRKQFVTLRFVGRDGTVRTERRPVHRRNPSSVITILEGPDPVLITGGVDNGDAMRSLANEMAAVMTAYAMASATQREAMRVLFQAWQAWPGEASQTLRACRTATTAVQRKSARINRVGGAR